MLTHHSLIHNDPFSWTMGGQPFVGFEYGSQIIYALVHRVAGLAGVAIFAELIRRGWSDADLSKLAGQNVLRAFHQAEAVAKKRQQTEKPSTATIQELDGVGVS
jgi:hypothetical protein